MNADRHALALEADIPPGSSGLSRLILRLSEMIHDAEKLSKQHGDTLLAAARDRAAAASVNLTTEVVRGQVAFLGQTATEMPATLTLL